MALARALAAESDVLMNGGTRVLALPARAAIAGTNCALVLRPELNGELDGSLALWGRDSRDLDRGIVYLLARFRNLLLRRTNAVVAISEAIAREAAGILLEKDPELKNHYQIKEKLDELQEAFVGD